MIHSRRQRTIIIVYAILNRELIPSNSEKTKFGARNEFILAGQVSFPNSTSSAWTDNSDALPTAVAWSGPSILSRGMIRLEVEI